ncbi:hypothetical protein BGM09_35600 [Streptomyces sp. CBMA29]|nr:hypothetical protein [Streptomyces sp. CBMA29]
MTPHALTPAPPADDGWRADHVGTHHHRLGPSAAEGGITYAAADFRNWYLEWLSGRETADGGRPCRRRAGRW